MRCLDHVVLDVTANAMLRPKQCPQINLAVPMEQISGMGPKRVKLYGAAFLKVLAGSDEAD